MNEKHRLLSVSDLKSEGWISPSGQVVGWFHEQPTDRFFSTDAVDPSPTIPTMRRALSRHGQGPGFQLLGSVSVHGLCATDLSRKSARHRSLFAFARFPALPLGNSR